MEILKLFKFLFFNVILPLFDVGTDVQAFILYLFYDNHPSWAYLTLFWIFNPFFVHLFKFAFVLYSKKKADWYNLFLHFPFVIPFKNCKLAFELHKLNFGEAGGKDWEEVEKIQREVARTSLSESFFEAGPQASQQLVIGFSTGQFRWNIILSIVISLFSLSWGASRAYFIQRSDDQSDPDPNVYMVGFRVFPWIVLMVANSLIQWTILGGLLGYWVFFVMAINFLCNYATVKQFYVQKGKTSDLIGSERGGLVLETSLTKDCVPNSNNVNNTDEESGQAKARFLEASRAVAPRQKGFFPLKSAITALWLPSVVGDHECVFLSTVISTLVTKVFFLILAVALAFSGQQQSVFRHPIILWCEDEWSPESLAGNIALCSFDTSTNFTSCFETSSTSGVQQKLRVCGSEEDELVLQISILVTVIVTNCLSLGAGLWLNKIKDYVELYRATRRLLWCIPTTPVVHRSAIFALVNSSDKDDIFEEMMEGALKSGHNISEAVSRPNRQGTTPLYDAFRLDSPKKAALLMRNGAKVNEVPILSLLVSAEEYPLEKFSKSLVQHKVNILDFINKPNSSGVEKLFAKGDWEGALFLWCFGAKPEKGEMLMEHAGLHPRGIQHVVECPALVPCLQNWKSSNGVDKEEAEQTIRDLFVDTVKVIFIPDSTMEEEKKRELRSVVKEWNRGDTRPKCELTWNELKSETICKLMQQ